ncbi:MAG: ABC transporter ATP-binding protein [Desulfomicrobium sp.]|nr:ABC transporter ATP-binding protein [Pseudomonadota bacterium]MBV1714060.1 ABC transporter ATP-binding protein [Desulfomicrobium sp.]MBU4571597.1 ABC transporter ATP-binding protein [Pseudomonadota bacterium]MBU4595745.1 ABC transporter ATP-binding protein [Pseudomonadota bacterium]MBV1721663.1 ABC transporter ATP-binding protein [Desulfomicrobium sp.]
MSEVYSLHDVGMAYEQGEETITVLAGVNLTVRSGDSLAIVGASGSGKSTLLQLMGTLDVPTSGTILFNGADISTLGWKDRARIRNRNMGFVFQFHHLLPEFSTRENAAMPGIIGGMARALALEKADAALSRVGLAHRRHHRVTTLSGGERQRAAIARAILLEPAVVLADEPTGNLDERTGREINELLLHLNKDQGVTLVVVTHNAELAQSMHRTLELRSGELYET